jgi:integrase
VPDAHVDATLPFVLPPVRAMIELQRVTGMRPGEVCAMRPCDLDTAGATWLYRPPAHKMAYRGKPRVVALGPRAQAIVKPFLPMKVDDYLFSPARAIEEQRAARRAARVVPIWPKQETARARRRNSKPRRAPGPCYTAHSYNRTVAYACERAGVVAEPAAA